MTRAKPQASPNRAGLIRDYGLTAFVFIGINPMQAADLVNLIAPSGLPLAVQPLATRNIPRTASAAGAAASPGSHRVNTQQTTPHAVGRAFEGMFASLLVKQMRQGLDGKTMFGNDKSDALGGLFDHFLGEHMASNGGLGIGAMIRRQLESRSATHGNQPTQRLPAPYAGTAIPLYRAPAARSVRPGVSAAAPARPGGGPSAS
jgi:Rod binding domain-containing protein